MCAAADVLQMQGLTECGCQSPFLHVAYADSLGRLCVALRPLSLLSLRQAFVPGAVHVQADSATHGL
jgi:hypothetical protein